jgi:PIN domain nuclease of toxin-antitoxin system
VNLLLDTHAFIWMLQAPEKLSAKVLEAYARPTNTCFVSVVSLWEIQIKHATGKLRMDVPLEQLIREQFGHYQSLHILPAHVLELDNLPRLHSDPFDRMLIAQSRVESLPLVSADRIFESYPVELFW